MRLLAILALVASLSGCGGGQREEPVGFERLETFFHANPISAVDPSAVPSRDDRQTYYYVFESQAAWSDWWRRATSRNNPSNPPAVDFSTQLVAGIYLGMRTNGCYAVRVEDVVVMGGGLVVRYRESRPPTAEPAACSAAVTYPLDLVVVRATGLPVRFVDVTAQ